MLCDSFKVLEQPFLGRTVVIRRDRQAANHAAIVKSFGQANRLCGCIGTGAGNNRNTPVGQFQRLHDHVTMLFMAQCCGLSGSSYRNDRRGAAGDMIINQFFQA